MAESGMLKEYNGQYKNAVSPEMKKAILDFTRNSQNSEDGYFYHPQWGKSISSTRLGRDLGWATRIIGAFGEKPLWDTPNGVDGEQDIPDSKVFMTSSLRACSVLPVSKVMLVAAPAYLKDLELFKEHLEKDYDWENNSYRAGNAIESELGQIQNAGTEYENALIEFLNSKQKPNGLWENSITYDSVNGLMKISVAYTSLEREIPNAEAAMNSALTMLKSEDSASHVCSVYNPWEAVANIFKSIKKVSGAQAVQKLRKPFVDNAEELIKITLNKLLVFKKDDGGFSYYIKYSAANSQGSAVALEKTAESDVNATMICVNSIIIAMFDVFGIAPVNRYYPIDFAFLSDTLTHLGTIIKDEIPEAEVITFDEYDPDMGNIEGGVVMTPDDYVENIVSDKEINNSGYKWFRSDVVKNPDPDAAKDDMVLYSKSNVCVGEEKSLADKPSSTRFKIGYADLAVLGNCFVYDADMYFVPGYGKISNNGKPTSDPLLQIFFMTESLPQASVNLSVYTENGIDYVKIGENYAGLDGKEPNIAGGIPMGKWVNIRLEYYKVYETVEIEGKEKTVFKPALKIFVDGKFMGDCDATITAADGSGQFNYYDRKIDQVSVSYCRNLASEVYFNNVLVERTRKEYVKGENPDAMIEPPLPDEELRESYGFEDGLLNTSNVVNKIRVVDFGVKKYINASVGQKYNPYISYSIVQDPKNAVNNVLKVSALKDEEFDKPSRTEVNLYNSAANGTDYIFESKFYYDSDSIGINGDLTQLFFMNSLDGQLYSIRISAWATKGVFRLSIIENNVGDSEKDIGKGTILYENIACDEWFTLKIVFHRTGIAETTGADIYLNGELVATDESYKGAALDQNPLVKVVLSHQKTNNCTVYLDDISFKKSGEIKDVIESDNPVADFTDGFNTKYLHSYSYSGNELLGVTDIDPIKMETLYTKFYLYKDPKDAANMVLKAVNKNSTTKAGYTRVDISGDNAVGDIYTFETKMYIETFTAGYNLTQIKFVDTNDGVAFNTYISIDSATKKLKIATTGSETFPAAGTNLLSDSDVSVTKEEWFTVKMELYHKGVDSTEENTYLKLYVNDILAYDGVAYGALGAEIAFVDIVHCKTAKSSAVLFDDVSLTRSDVPYFSK